MTKVVINQCYGGFGLSDAAYEKLIEWGVPVRKYVEQVRGPDGLYDSPPENEGEIIFERDKGNDYVPFLGRYWDTWTRGARSHPLVVRAVEELGDEVNGWCASLAVVEVPDDVEWEISEYDGMEHVAETHRTWS